MLQYGPPETDSEDDYEGFSFGDDDIKPRGRPLWRADSHQDLINAVTAGNLDNVIEQIRNIKLNINEPLRSGNTLLHHACKQGHIEIVKYLIQQGANVNRQVDSITPLMDACSSIGDSKIAKKIVQILLKEGAVINVSTRMGKTPFMFACIHGHTDIVQLLIKNVYLEAVDNQGWTAIFHAIENNQPRIVQLLIESGAEVNNTNGKGYTPRQVAQFHGFADILEILPPEEYKYFVPTHFITYTSLRDFIPRLFHKSDVPEYFQEIDKILNDMKMGRFLENFAQHRIELSEFLTMTDEKLQAVGILMPFYRNKFLLGLVRFHLDHWKTRDIARVKRKEKDSFYDILMLSANHLKHLVIVNSAIQYVKQNVEHGEFGDVDIKTIRDLRKAIRSYKDLLANLKKTTVYLQSFSPKKPALYVDYDEYVAEKRRNTIRKFVKYSILIGISVLVCLKMKNIF